MDDMFTASQVSVMGITLNDFNCAPADIVCWSVQDTRGVTDCGGTGTSVITARALFTTILMRSSDTNTLSRF